MDIKDYEFHIGDEVITTDGIKGKITKVCTCGRCEERGFHELFWTDEHNDYEHYIDKYIAENGFCGYYKIGKYRFNDFDKNEVLQYIASCENEIKKLKEQLRVIEKYEHMQKIIVRNNLGNDVTHERDWYISTDGKIFYETGDIDCPLDIVENNYTFEVK